MLKYVNTAIVFSEVPDEITLAVEISGCPIHCPACHSKHLWEDIGTEITYEELDKMLNTPAITCICFMGGDQDLDNLEKIFEYCYNKNKLLRIAWYSGREQIPKHKCINYLDYIKIGPYKEEYGPINQKTTNQRMIAFNHPRGGVCADWYEMDITYKFWK